MITFSENCRKLFKFSCRNRSPTTSEGYASIDRALLVYRIALKLSFDFGQMVYEHILQLALKPEAKFYILFLSLVYQLLQLQHPVKVDVEKHVSLV